MSARIECLDGNGVVEECNRSVEARIVVDRDWERPERQNGSAPGLDSAVVTG